MFQRREWECVFPGPAQPRQRQAKGKAADVEDRLAQVERLLQEQFERSSAPAAAPAIDNNIVVIPTPEFNDTSDEAQTIPQSLSDGVASKVSRQQIQRPLTTLSSMTASPNQGPDDRSRHNDSVTQTHVDSFPGLTAASDCASLWDGFTRTIAMDMDLETAPIAEGIRDRGVAVPEEVKYAHPPTSINCLSPSNCSQIDSEDHGETRPSSKIVLRFSTSLNQEMRLTSAYAQGQALTGYHNAPIMTTSSQVHKSSLLAST